MRDRTPDRRNVPDQTQPAPSRSAQPGDPRLLHQQAHQTVPQAPPQPAQPAGSAIAQQLVAGFVAPIEFMMRQLITEAIAPLPKVTPEEVEAAVDLGVQKYHESSDLEERIGELARRLAEEIAGAKAAEIQKTVAALPKVTPQDVEGAVDRGVQRFHDSALLEKRIADLARSLADGIAAAKIREVEKTIESLPKVTPEQVEEVRRSAGERAKAIEAVIAALPKVTPEQVQAAVSAGLRPVEQAIEALPKVTPEQVQGAVAAALRPIEKTVESLPKVTPEQVQEAVRTGVQSYHDSAGLEKRIEELGRRVAEEIAGAKSAEVQKAVAALPKVTPADVEAAVAQGVQKYHESPLLDKRIADLARGLAEEIAAGKVREVEKTVAALPKVTPEQVQQAVADVRRWAGEQAQRIEGSIDALPKVTPEQVQASVAAAVRGFQESPELDKRIGETARRLAEEIAGAKSAEVERTIAAIPKVTLGQVDAAIEMRLDSYQESPRLQDRIRDLARQIAEERVRGIERAIEAVPRMTPEQVDAAVGKGLQKYHDSPLLDARIGELARLAAEEVAQEKARGLERSLEGLPKVTRDDVESTVRIALQDYHQSRELRDRIEDLVHRIADERVRRIEQSVGALPKLSPEQIDLIVGRGVKKYHDSPDLQSRIQGIARLAAEEIAGEKIRRIEAVVAAAPKVTPESIDLAVARGVQRIQDSAQQRERVAEDRLKKLEETSAALPRIASEQLDAAKSLRTAEDRVRKVEESLAAVPKLAAEQAETATQHLRAAAERVKKLEEAVASIPRVTPELLDSAVGKGLQKVVELPDLQKRILELAHRVAVDQVKKVEDSVAALPKTGPEEVKGAVEKAIAELPQSPALKDWVNGIAAQKIAEAAAAAAPPITPDDVAGTVRKSLEESLQSPQWAERIRQATEEMFKETSSAAARSAAEEARTAAQEEVESHHASEQFVRRVEKQARQVVMEMISPEAVRELVRQALEEFRNEMPKAQEQFAPSEEVPVFVLPEGQEGSVGGRSEDVVPAAAGGGESFSTRMNMLMERLALLETQLRARNEPATSRYHSFTRKRVGRR